jgi:hypothetical protein
VEETGDRQNVSQLFARMETGERPVYPRVSALLYQLRIKITVGSAELVRRNNDDFGRAKLYKFRFDGRIGSLVVCSGFAAIHTERRG